MPTFVAGNSPVTLDQFKAAETADARGTLGACSDIERCVCDVEAGRPYPSGDSLRAAASDSAEASAGRRWPARLPVMPGSVRSRPVTRLTPRCPPPNRPG